MRTLTDSLLAAQKQPSRIPYVKVEAKNTLCGVVKLKWTRLYTGSEPDYFHAVTMPGDGSLVRARVTPQADGRKLYRQRVASPGAQSDFSQWVYTNQYDALAVACCSLGAEVSIFWVKTSQELYRIKSTDYGATWGSPELIDYTPTTAIGGLAAAYKPNGDLALFFTDQAVLYVIKRVSGNWQSRVAWDKSTGNLSGVATTYDSDWKLVVSGKDSGGDFKLWSLVYGDGGEVSAGTWSALKTIASAPSDGAFEYYRVYLDKPDVFRCFFVEKFSGIEAYARPFWSHSVADTGFLSNSWREPVPFNLSSEYGLALAHPPLADYCWLSAPNGVWRAKLTQESLNLSADVISLKKELTQRSGKLVAELRNDGGRYAAPGQGNLLVLDTGCDVALGPGYVTSQGNEVSPGLSFILQAYEHTSAGGKASLVLYGADTWSLLETWVARHQFRWNKDSDEASVKDILALVLARVGLKLEVKSQSSVITGFYPDFTIHPNDRGTAVVERLLSFVPDVISIEGNKAYLVSPLSTDSSAYSYGGAHAILEGRYRKGAWALNRVQVEGRSGSDAIVADSFAWDEIDRLYDRLAQLEDRNIKTVAKAQQRGDAYLREAEIESGGGVIRIPVNCGQQMFDVIDMTDSRAGLSAAKRRVLGITLVYEPRRGDYEHRLSLGLP